MAAFRHLGFLKVGNFHCPHPSESQNASSCQILCRSVKALRKYGRFRFFKMAAVRHLGFLKVGNFNCPHPSEGQNASSYRILCRSVKPLRRYGRLQFFKMAAVRHLGFLKVQNFNGSYPSEGQTASSGQFFFANQSRRCGDMAVFDFARWRPSAILDLWYACLDHPRSVFWWSLSLCKIWFQSVQ